MRFDLASDMPSRPHDRLFVISGNSPLIFLLIRLTLVSSPDGRVVECFKHALVLERVASGVQSILGGSVCRCFRQEWDSVGVGVECDRTGRGSGSGQESGSGLQERLSGCSSSSRVESGLYTLVAYYLDRCSPCPLNPPGQRSTDLSDLCDLSRRSGCEPGECLS